MRKLFLLAAFTGFLKQGMSQAYLELVVYPETTLGACDARVVAIPHHALPPYRIQWARNSNTIPTSNGLQRNNVCSGEVVNVSILDANCYELSARVFIAPNPANQVYLDTVIIDSPTTGNTDGGFEVRFGTIPAGTVDRVFFDPISSSGTSDSVFTGLGESPYAYSLQINSVEQYLLTIPLWDGMNEPCDLFESEVVTTNLTYDFTALSGCTGNYEVGGECDGSFSISSSGLVSGEYAYYGYYAIAGGVANDLDTFNTAVFNLCRGPHGVYIFSDYSTGNNFNNTITRFVGDAADTTYEWNIPDTIPANTDTLIFNSLDLPQVQYYQQPDTLYVDYIELLGADQYEITFALVQQGDTSLFFTNGILDTSLNYVFEITNYVGDSLTCGLEQDAMRHLIYYEFPAPASPEDTCYTGNGNGHHHHGNGHGYGHGNGHNHNGPCNEEELRASWVDGKAATSIAANGLTVFPNPFRNELQIKSATALTRIEIYSVEGKLKKQVHVNSLNCTISVNELEASTYIVKTYDAHGKTAFARVVKTE
ncbi:MAG TPA: T9SS type A sorting domain-containing protein [Flavobacteriales bacterium]|nr:T9SS type A sorting domain-containing protein [Flavobacteriales bacterium]